MKLLSTLAIALTLGVSSVSADVVLDNLDFTRTASAGNKVVYLLLDGGNVTPEAVCADKSLNAGGVITYTPAGKYTTVPCAE